MYTIKMKGKSTEYGEFDSMSDAEEGIVRLGALLRDQDRRSYSAESKKGEPVELSIAFIEGPRKPLKALSRKLK